MSIFKNEVLKSGGVNVPARASFIYMLINVLAKGAAFVFTPIFTRLLGPSEYGEFSLFSSYLSLAVVIGSLELSGGVIITSSGHNRHCSR